jgi:uncharacterized protein
MADPALAADPQPPPRALIIEILVVLAVGVLPDLTSAICWLGSDHAGRPSFGLDAVMLISRSISVVAVVLFIMWRSGEGWGHFGLRPPRLIDPLLAAGILGCAYLASWLLVLSIPGPLWLGLAELDPPAESLFGSPSGSAQYLLLGLMSLANGSAEQLVISAYLFTRLQRVLNGTGKAIMVSAVVFASYHIYQGPLAALHIFIAGIVTVGAFAWLRRFWPVALAHALADFVAYTV